MRLFGILERLVVWENSNDPGVLEEARVEIEKSCDGELPNVLDPFCGGGAIPLEARRLGLPAFGGDLNPVAVLVSKGLVEIPQRFAGLPPVNPDTNGALEVQSWDRAQGLAEDIGYYGRWMRERAFKRIGHLYPKVRLPASEGGGEATVIAWLWARTVGSPDPSWGGHVPLVRSWVIRKAKKSKPAAWVEPVVDRTSQTISYRIREGEYPPGSATVDRRGGTCLATGSPIGFPYIREQGRQGKIGRVLTAAVAEGNRGRVYVPLVSQPQVPEPGWNPNYPLPERTLGFRVQQYGMVMWADLFTDRQLVALSTFSEVLSEVRSMVEADAKLTGLTDDGKRLGDRGVGVTAYADAVVTYLALALDKLADLNNSLVRWEPGAQCPRQLFARQALPMVWDFAEANPLGSSSGSWEVIIAGIVRAFRSKAWPLAQRSGVAGIAQRDAVARIREVESPAVCTDPPYYDNISYADLSDFFYVWLRRNLADVWPEENATLLSPKVEELIANPYRAGSKQAAREHFEGGMTDVLRQVASSQNSQFPATIFYAYKQQEIKEKGRTSTGWETFLQALIDAGLQVSATWPIRTETQGRAVAQGTAALASSIVIACRPRRPDAPLATRREFLDALQAEMPGRVQVMQREAILPGDMAQSAIGPGMEVFSRYAKVVEADGTEMRVRTAIGLINEALQEALSSDDAELDADSRWALTWYEQTGHEAASYGEADTLLKAKNTTIDSVERAGIVENVAGKVRLLTRDELVTEWDPVADPRRTDWKLTQYLIVSLAESEVKAGSLLRAVGGGMGERARRLAWLLFEIADRKGWSSDAFAYNGLIRAWHDIQRHAKVGPPEEQTFEGM